MATQPLVAPMGGIIGLNYTVFPFVCDLYDVPAGQRQELFRLVCTVETVAAQRRRVESESRSGGKLIGPSI